MWYRFSVFAQCLNCNRLSVFCYRLIFLTIQGESCSGHLYSPLPYSCVYSRCRLKWQHIMHFLFSLGTKRNTKFHGVAGMQLGRLPIVGLTGRITVYRGNDCLIPTSNNSTVHAVSRGYTSGRAKWQFTKELLSVKQHAFKLLASLGTLCFV